MTSYESPKRRPVCAVSSSAPRSQWSVPSRSPNRDCRSQARGPGASRRTARASRGRRTARGIAEPAHESDALPLSCTDATLVNEKFVNVAVNVATPSARVASPSLAHAPRSVTSADDTTATRQGRATPPPNHMPARWWIEQVDARLDVDLVVAERAIVHRAAGVADHLGADAVDGGRRERAGDDAVGELERLLGEERGAARLDRGVRTSELERLARGEEHSSEGTPSDTEYCPASILETICAASSRGAGTSSAAATARMATFGSFISLSSFGSPAALRAASIAAWPSERRASRGSGSAAQRPDSTPERYPPGRCSTSYGRWRRPPRPATAC